MAGIPFDTIVFDLDGTLADTAPDLAAALNHTLQALGRAAIDPEAVRQLIGQGARALLRRGLAATGDAPEALVDRGFPIFIERYSKNICTATAAYPGLETALEALCMQGLALAICTNKPERLTHQLISALGWQRRFNSIVGGDTLLVRKPDPAPLLEAIARTGGRRAVFVGDSITDADTAKAAGIPFVAVSFGYSDRPVDQLSADAVINSYAQLGSALAGL